MVKCHVVDIHLTPLRESQHTYPLLHDGPNATLLSETLRWNCVWCHNRKRGCKNRQKRCETFAMTDAPNTVQILVACAMQGIWFSSINCLWWGGTKEMGSQMKVCAIYIIRFTRMNCVWLGNTMEMVQLNKMCVIRGKQVCNHKCVRRPIITQTIAANKPCDMLCLQNNNMYIYITEINIQLHKWLYRSFAHTSIKKLHAF